MWDFIFVMLQIFLWIVVGGIFTVILAIPVIAVLGIFELIMKLTLNNIFMVIHKIPLIGPVISGIVCTGIGAIICVLGIIVWVNYIFISLRCIAGPKF